MKNNSLDVIYYATVSWDGMDEYTQGDRTITRMNIEDLVEGVEEYLLTFESRHPYLECASVEYEKDREVYDSKDLTDTIKTIIKTKENKDNESK